MFTYQGRLFQPNRSLLGLRKPTENHGFLVSRALADQNKSKVKISAMNYLNRDITTTKDIIVPTIQIVEEVVHVDLECDENKIDETKLLEHLQCLLDKVSPKVISEQKLKIKYLLIDYQDIFRSPDGN